MEDPYMTCKFWFADFKFDPQRIPRTHSLQRAASISNPGTILILLNYESTAQGIPICIEYVKAPCRETRSGQYTRFFVQILGTDESGGTNFYSFDNLIDAREFITSVRKKYTAIAATI